MQNMLDDIFNILINTNSSDLHWADGAPIYLRINGIIGKIDTPQKLQNIDFTAFTKQLIGTEPFDLFLKTKEYDGARTIIGNRRIRINIFYKRSKIAWAIRMLPSEFFTLEQLGLPMDICQQICELKQGLVLITGATGSGKTSTLASILNEINKHRQEHIFTIEDPIEYIHESKQCMISQREVGQDTSNFSGALKSLLREDPDIVLLGEMRDRESMDAALTLAETGHLTFATLHTSGAVETTSRIISNFESAEQGQVRERIADNLKFVISQQLIPWTNGDGRSLCAEIMVTTKAIKAMIRDNKERQMLSTLETSSNDGMTTMNKSLLELVKQRKITAKEAILYSPDKDAIVKLL
jgi:twitching motility protein PilT